MELQLSLSSAMQSSGLRIHRLLLPGGDQTTKSKVLTALSGNAKVGESIEELELRFRPPSKLQLFQFTDPKVARLYQLQPNNIDYHLFAM